MNHDDKESSDPRHQILQSYLVVTQKLTNQVNTAEDSLDIEKMNDLLSERDKLIDFFNGYVQEIPPSQQINVLIGEIQKFDFVLMKRLELLRQSTHEKLSELQIKKRGLLAYRGDYTYDAAFIDKKK